MLVILFALIFSIFQQKVISNEWIFNFNCDHFNKRLIKYQKVLNSKCELFLIPNQDSHKNSQFFKNNLIPGSISCFFGSQGLGLIF